MNRSEFLNKLSLACLSSSYFIKRIEKIAFKDSLLNKRLAPCPSREAKSASGSNYFIDMHCHPSLKFYLWGKRIWKHHPSKKGSNILNMQVDVKKVLSGNVKGLLAAHYLPEKGLVQQSKKLHKLIAILQFFAPVLNTKIEQGTSANFEQLSVMLDEFEEQVEIANNKLGIKKTRKDLIKIARSYEEFENNINAGIISIAQTIEGSHALGRDMSGNSGEKYLTNLDRLFERGICLITLAHYFQNDLCFPVESMPPWDKAKLKFRWRYNPESDDKPLTSIGRSIVVRMLEKGMIVDITHLTPCARKEVFLINEMFNRPIVFSHAGVQGLFSGPKELKDASFFPVLLERIKKIPFIRKEEVDMITHENALRVLREGWKK